MSSEFQHIHTRRQYELQFNVKSNLYISWDNDMTGTVAANSTKLSTNGTKTRFDLIFKQSFILAVQ